MTRDELEAMVRIHQAEIYRYLRYLGAVDSNVAEDLVQETFLGAFQSSNRPTEEKIRDQAAWLRGIARNVFLMHCRKKRNQTVTANSESVEQAEAVWDREFLRGGDGFETIEALRGCLQKVEGKHRRLLELFYAEDRSRAQLAAEFKMSEDGVKSLMRRLRSSLGECIRRKLAQG